MKKLMAGLLVSALAVSILGCGSKQAEETPAAEETTEAEETAAETEAEPEPVTLNIFAAASMTETLTEIQEMYKETAPNVTLVFNFDSSGTLKTQIQEGADCDIFISAAQKQMNQLDKDANPEVNTEGLDFVLEGTRVNLLENKVVLAVPDGNPKDIQNFEDLGTDKLSLLALGNEHSIAAQGDRRRLGRGLQCEDQHDFPLPSVMMMRRVVGPSFSKRTTTSSP